VNCFAGANRIQTFMDNKMKLLIAFDGSRFAEAAIDDLGRAGLPDAGEAVVMSVTDVWELPEIIDRVTPRVGKPTPVNIELIGRHLQEVIERTSVIAESAAARVRDMLPGWDVKTEACTGKAAVELIRFSDKWSPDLMVLGSHGRGFVGRALLGSVSLKALHESRCSVRISRESVATSDGVLRILVAVDGSANADLAVETAVGRNWPEKTEFRIITADDDVPSRPETSVLDEVPEGKEDSDEAKVWVDRVLKGPYRELTSAGLSVSQACRWGDARRVILDEAESWNADCIFMGARGLGRFKRLLLGSVSETVAVRANCSVEIVRMPDAKQP
jgi:nucleotide-binding universal stress UspA family protein